MAVTEVGLAVSRALDELYRRHGTHVYRYAYAVLGSHADAEDVTQTTFLNAHRALEQGVTPRAPENWLLAIASNVLKQRFRQELSRPRHVELDAETPADEVEDPDGPSVAELLSALSRIPASQRQALVLREFEGRSYAEIAEILGVSASALETLLFRARRYLAEELENRIVCTEAQLAVSRLADGRLGRRERRRLKEHVAECPDCTRFARVQQRHRTAFRSLALVPVPVSLSLLKGMEGSAAAATLPLVAGSAAATTTIATGSVAGGGAVAATGGAIVGGGLAAKAAAVAAAVTVASGVGVGVHEVRGKDSSKPVPARAKVLPPAGHMRSAPHRGANMPGAGTAASRAQGQRATTTRPVPANTRAGKTKASAQPSKTDRTQSAKTESRKPETKPANGPVGSQKASQAPEQRAGRALGKTQP